MDCHEISDVFPAMSDAEFKDLASDIAKKGLVEPIWTHEDQIVDGRHRYRACCMLGIAPSFQPWDGQGGSLTGFVVSKNIHRRHLDANQRASIAAKMKPRLEEEIKLAMQRKAKEFGKLGGRGNKKPEETKGFGTNTETLCEPRDARKELAEMIGVSERYISRAEHIRDAAPDLANEIRAGNMTIPEAERRMGVTSRNASHVGNAIKLTLSPDPEDACRTLVKYFQGEQLEELVDHLANFAGYRLVKK